MTLTAFGLVAAILLSCLLGTYLLRRQVHAVAAHRDAPPADFAGSVSREEHSRAADYTIAKARFAMGEGVYDATVSTLWILFWLTPLYALIASVTEPGLTRSVLVVLAFGAANYILALPIAFIRTFRLEACFGFNRATPAIFAMDELKGALLSLALATPLLYAMFALLAAFPASWWIYAYVGFMGVMMTMMIVYPTIIAPMFNTFTPMEDGTMKTRMEALLAKCGFESKGLFVMDASKRSSHGNAYFSGFGKAKRIVFFDTLLAKHSLEEIEAILAHELGHFKFGHVRQNLLQMAGLALVGFAVLGLAFASGNLADWLALPSDPGVVLIALLIAKDPILHLLSPALSWRSRKAEFEADDFARRIVGEQPMITALTRLSRENLSTLTPDPVYAAFYYSHPPVPLRVAQLRAS